MSYTESVYQVERLAATLTASLIITRSITEPEKAAQLFQETLAIMVKKAKDRWQKETD